MTREFCEHRHNGGFHDQCVECWRRRAEELEAERERFAENLAMLVRREIVTTDAREAATCCGLERDADGFCQHRPGHRIYLQTETNPIYVQRRS